MRVTIDNRTTDATSYRAARVKSLFNVDDGSRFQLTTDVPVERDGWRLGVVVGPSGSGKSSIGRHLTDTGRFEWMPEEWPDGPIVDHIAPGGDFDAATAALGQVGLGDVPAWLRPHVVLSNGEKFRANLARVMSDPDPAGVIVDEFSSVVDRQIAKIGSRAFAKGWRRRPDARQAVLLSCHYDILPWVEPDWVIDLATGHELKEWERRPVIEVEVRGPGDWSLWPYFKPHHYLEAGPMPGGRTYTAWVNGEPVAHLGMSTRNVGRSVEGRACRMVVLPEWQGAGVGLRFLNTVCELQRTGAGVQPGRRMTTTFHTSHPHLCASLRRDPKWVQLSAVLHGGNKKRSARSIASTGAGQMKTGGYGGHFRAVQGFRYTGDRSNP